MTRQPPVSTASSSATNEKSFAEVALRPWGASEDEATRTGKLDSADDQVETMFAGVHRTTGSPIHRAVWDRSVPTTLFDTVESAASEDVASVVNRSLAVVQRHQTGGTLLDDNGKIAEAVLEDLATVGYWGLLVDPQFGGSGASMQQFSRMITKMAAIEPTIAGLASVHGCIGAVDPLRAFGSDEQKNRLLPGLASGKRLSAFALTEPGAGSDLTALKTTAVRDGDDYVINGEKLFITNAIPGRTIGLVCMLENRPAVFIVELDDQENDNFRLKRYGLYALRRTNNNGLIFRDFRVPAANLLTPSHGDGLTIAYHGLNRGRVALCANAAGTMRWMLAEMLPWASYRNTYGQPIENRELVRRRIGQMAGMIVACDALTSWCSGLLDQGYRGEMECIIAKIFGSEMQKTAAIELFMKTHGGRSFLHGHTFGDNVHEFLAPCIYEGEGEMLGMAFFKSLVKEHGKHYFEPIGRVLSERGVTKPNLADPSVLWALRRPMMAYSKWYLQRCILGGKWTEHPNIDAPLQRHVRFAQHKLAKSGRYISDVMRTHQLKLADRQCRMSALSAGLQDSVVMLVTALHASKQDDPIVTQAADAICRQLRTSITGRAASDADFRQVTKLGAMIVDEGWRELGGTTAGPVLMPYKSNDLKESPHDEMAKPI